jgi:hypothetical protein
VTTPENGQNPAAIQMGAQLDQLVAQNKQGFEELTRQGVQFDPTTLIMAQIECLYDTLGEAMGPVQGPQFVLLARLRWEQRISQNIAQAREQGRKSQLAMGGSFSPAMIRELAKSTRTFGA